LTQLDFSKIREHPIAEVASMLGITLTQKDAQLVGTCPISGAGNRTAFKLTPGMNRFFCFCPECRKLPKPGGDCIELVRRFRKLTNPRDAAAEIAAHFGAGKVADNAPPQQEVEPSRKPADFDPLAYQQSLDPYHDALSDFDPGVIKELGGGYSVKGLNRQRLVLPIYDETRTIKAFVGIALKGEEPDLLYPKGYKPPFYMGCQNIGEGTLYLSPHPKDMLAAMEGGVTNVLALLRPITADTLVCLTALMRARGCTELELL